MPTPAPIRRKPPRCWGASSRSPTPAAPARSAPSSTRARSRPSAGPRDLAVPVAEAADRSRVVGPQEEDDDRRAQDRKDEPDERILLGDEVPGDEPRYESSRKTGEGGSQDAHPGGPRHEQPRQRPDHQAADEQPEEKYEQIHCVGFSTRAGERETAPYSPA